MLKEIEVRKYVVVRFKLSNKREFPENVEAKDQRVGGVRGFKQRRALAE